VVLALSVSTVGVALTPSTALAQPALSVTESDLNAWCIKQYQLAGYEGVQADSQQCAARNGRPLRAAEQAAFCQTGCCQGTPGSTPPSSGSGCGSGSGTSPGGAVSCRPTTQGDYYVATNGSDSHSCAQARNPATPKRSIRAAMACMSGGNTLLIRDGTYAECLKTPDFTDAALKIYSPAPWQKP